MTHLKQKIAFYVIPKNTKDPRNWVGPEIGRLLALYREFRDKALCITHPSQLREELKKRGINAEVTKQKPNRQKTKSLTFEILPDLQYEYVIAHCPSRDRYMLARRNLNIVSGPYIVVYEGSTWLDCEVFYSKECKDEVDIRA